jgi:hypothetical protein
MDSNNDNDNANINDDLRNGKTRTDVPTYG